VRLFIAADISNLVREELGECIRELESLDVDVRWVTLQNLHVTMKFLGRVDADKLSLIQERLKNLAAKAKPFTARLSSLGAFPNNQDPQIVWAGIGEGQKLFQELVVRVSNSMKGLGFEEENREYTAHVTLGRVRSKKNLKNLAKALLDKKYDSQYPFAVDQLTLFESITDSRGAIYKVVEKFPLSG